MTFLRILKQVSAQNDQNDSINPHTGEGTRSCAAVKRSSLPTAPTSHSSATCAVAAAAAPHKSWTTGFLDRSRQEHAAMNGEATSCILQCIANDTCINLNNSAQIVHKFHESQELLQADSTSVARAALPGERKKR